MVPLVGTVSALKNALENSVYIFFIIFYTTFLCQIKVNITNRNPLQQQDNLKNCFGQKKCLCLEGILKAVCD